MYVDGNGNFAFFILTAVIGAIIGGLAAGITSYQHGARGWEVVGWSALGSVCGGALGADVGAITSKLLTGIYASPYYTDPFSLSLPYDKLNQMNNISIYEVMNPITVNAGPAVPYFGQYGGGMQYRFGETIAKLIAEGILRRI